MKALYARTQFWFNLKGGGSVGHTLGVLQGLKENNCEVEVLSNDLFLGIDPFPKHIIQPFLKSPPRIAELLYNFYAEGKAIDIIRNARADFIYHRYTGCTFFIARAAQKTKHPLILEFNSFETWEMKNWEINPNPFQKIFVDYILYPIVCAIEKYNLTKAHKIIVVSQPLKEDLIQRDIPEDRIIVIPNGVDPQQFSPVISSPEVSSGLKSKLGFNNDQLVIGFSGTFGQWHGIPELTSAIQKIQTENMLPDTQFLLVGEGKLKPLAQEKIGRHPHVKFVGLVPYNEMPNYLSICDILLSPHSKPVDGREFFGSPTKLFEYMAMGKAIIASRLGQIGEVLHNGVNALTVPPGDVGALVQAIITLAQDKSLREKLGKQAREDAVTKHSWRSHIAMMLEKIKN